MTMQQCLACGGIYRPVQRDGTTYFHVCPPETMVATVALDGAKQERALEELAGVELVADRAALERRIAEGKLPAEVLIDAGRRERRRAQHRDENTLRREGARAEIRVIRSEGAGARPRPDLNPGDGA